tara:strand:+ start:242 stop:469 length:228 start_codon:yes stop_codon:yes gene_type:complete
MNDAPLAASLYNDESDNESATRWHLKMLIEDLDDMGIYINANGEQYDEDTPQFKEMAYILRRTLEYVSKTGEVHI